MTIDLKSAQGRRLDEQSVTWQERDAALYALAIGMGCDPSVESELAFVCPEGGLLVLPSFASTLVATSLLQAAGPGAARFVHTGERLLIHRPLGESGTLKLDGRITHVDAQADDAGRPLDVDWDARDGRGELVFTLQRQLLLQEQDAMVAFPEARTAPAEGASPPGLSCALKTRTDQALLYRLISDSDPSIASPQAARAAGVERPVLHGLCVWGIACRAILATICEYDITLVRALEGRFTGAAYPGETLMTEMRQQANVVSFRVLAMERGVEILNHGRCELAV